MKAVSGECLDMTWLIHVVFYCWYINRLNSIVDTSIALTLGLLYNSWHRHKLGISLSGLFQNSLKWLLDINIGLKMNFIKKCNSTRINKLKSGIWSVGGNHDLYCLQRPGTLKCWYIWWSIVFTGFYIYLNFYICHNKLVNILHLWRAFYANAQIQELYLKRNIIERLFSSNHDKKDTLR